MPLSHALNCLGQNVCGCEMGSIGAGAEVFSYHKGRGMISVMISGD